MIKVRQTAEFSHWLRRLEDDNAAGRILVRIRRAELGNLGDCRSVGGGVTEMRVDYGPGYQSILHGRARPSLCCCVAVTRARNSGTSSGLRRS